MEKLSQKKSLAILEKILTFRFFSKTWQVAFLKTSLHYCKKVYKSSLFSRINKQREQARLILLKKVIFILNYP